MLCACSFVWFISPEFDLDSIRQVSQQMHPALQLFYVHNGHMPDQDFDTLQDLSPDLPLVGMAPHVASYVTSRLQQRQQHCHHEAQLTASAALAAAAEPEAVSTAEWLLPTWPFTPQQPCCQVRLMHLHCIAHAVGTAFAKPI
jgi:hypothetical protein